MYVNQMYLDNSKLEMELWFLTRKSKNHTIVKQEKTLAHCQSYSLPSIAKEWSQHWRQVREKP